MKSIAFGFPCNKLANTSPLQGEVCGVCCSANPKPYVSPSSHRAFLSQLGDLCRLKRRLGENSVGVLTQSRRRTPPRAQRLREARHDVVHRHVAALGIRYIDDDSRLAKMRIG